VPYLRADWFVATASRPPLYHDLLQLPVSDRGLERLLQVDVLANLQEENVARAGFNDSGVSKNNRLIERHDAAYGAFWRSYDFAANTGRQSLFEHPLGPHTGETSFQHAGGEIIFHLPNGLHGFLLVDGAGRRIDKAPGEIVSDPKRPDQRVETGVSCMSCHVHGMIAKADQVRAHVEKNAKAFAPADRETVKALYLPLARMKALMNEDAERYLAALARTGVAREDAEPVSSVTLRYEGTLDLASAAAEVGLAPQEFLKRLQAAPTLTRPLGALQSKGGTVQRQAFLEAFPELVRAFRLGEEAAPDTAATAANTFVGHTGNVLCLAFSADGRQAASGGADHTVRLWSVASRNELRRFEGHSDEVTAVAFAPDGKRLLSGSRDRTLRLWDAAGGKEVYRFMGHTDRIRCVAFSADGRRALSAGDDGTVRLWDLDGRKELLCCTGHGRPVSSVVFTPDGRHFVSAGLDQTLRLWDAQTGQELRRFVGHTGEVYSAALSPSGRRLLSGGNDRTVRLWDTASGREVHCYKGHANAVICVAFTANGREILSGSSQYQAADEFLRHWDVESGKELWSLSRPAVSVGCLAFAPDGRSALSAGSDGSLRLWQWK
jgi:hypothetical protein